MGDIRRYKLQDELEDILGSKNVYFQPPESIRMNYPAIVYSRRIGHRSYADNHSYIWLSAYEVTVISMDPDFIVDLNLPDKFQYCRSDRHFVVDNLHHDVFIIYY